MIESLQQILAQETNGGTLFENMRPFFFVAGIVLAAFMLMRWSQRRMMQNQNRSNLSVQDRVEKSRQGTEIYSQIGELMSQLADLSRQINGQIDTRIAKLELLIREADRTIDRLQKLPGNESNKIDNDNLNPAPDGIETLRKISEKYHQTDIAESSETPPSNLENSADSGSHKKRRGTAESLPNKSDILLENQQILSLSQQGLSSIEIAQKLNRPIGEIELILSLNGKKYQ